MNSAEKIPTVSNEERVLPPHAMLPMRRAFLPFLLFPFSRRAGLLQVLVTKFELGLSSSSTTSMVCMYAGSWNRGGTEI